MDTTEILDNSEILLSSDSEDEIFFGAVTSPEKKKAVLLRNRKTEVFEAPLFVRRRSIRPSLSSHVEEDDMLNEHGSIDLETELVEISNATEFKTDNFTSSIIDSQSSSLECTKGSVNTQSDSWLTDTESYVCKNKDLCQVREEISIEEVCLVKEKSHNEEVRIDSIISEISYGEINDISLETSNADSLNCVKSSSNECLADISPEYSEDVSKEDFSEIDKENIPLFIRSDVTREIPSKVENSPVRENIQPENNCSVNFDNKVQDNVQNLKTAEDSSSLFLTDQKKDVSIVKDLCQVREEISLEEIYRAEDKSNTKEVRLVDSIISEVSATESYGEQTDDSMEACKADSQYKCFKAGSIESSSNIFSQLSESLNKKDICEINKEKEPLFTRSDHSKKIDLIEVENVYIRENFELENNCLNKFDKVQDDLENVKTTEDNKDSSLVIDPCSSEKKEQVVDFDLKPCIKQNDTNKEFDNVKETPVSIDNDESKSPLPETTVIASGDKLNLFKNNFNENQTLPSPDLIKDIIPKTNGGNSNVSNEDVRLSDGSTAVRATKPRESFFTSLEVIDVDNEDVYEGFMAHKGNKLVSDDSGLLSASHESSKCRDKYEISHQNQKTPIKKQDNSEHDLDNSMNYESSPVTPPPNTFDKKSEIEVDDNDDSLVKSQSFSFTKPTSFINWTRTKNTKSQEENSNSDCSDQESDQCNMIVNVNADEVSIITIDSQDYPTNQIPRAMSYIDSYGEENKAMRVSKTLSLNSETSSLKKVESPDITNNSDYRSPMTENETKHTTYYTVQEEMDHVDSTNEDDNLDRSVESSDSDSSPKRVFNDTIEEMEMLLKYGVNYSENKNNVKGQIDNQVVKHIKSPVKESNDYDDGNYDSCSDEEVVIVPSPRKNSVASIVSNFQPVLDSTRADFTKISTPVDIYIQQPRESYDGGSFEPWKPYEQIQNISFGSPEVQVLSPIDIIKKKAPTKPPRNVLSPLLYSPRLIPNESKIPSPNSPKTSFYRSPNLTPGGSRKMSPNYTSIKSSLPSPRVSPSTPSKMILGHNIKQGTPKTTTVKAPNSSPYTTPRSTASRLVRESPSRTTVGKLGGSARKAGVVNRGTTLVRTGSLTNLADQWGAHTPKSVGSVRLPNNNARVGISSIQASGMRTKDALPPRPTPSKQPIKTITRQPSHTTRHMSTAQSKTTRGAPTTPTNSRLHSPAMRKVNQQNKVVGGLSIVSPVAKYLQNNPPPQFVVNIQPKSRSSPKSCNNSPTTTKIPSPVATQNIFDSSGMERQIRLDKIQNDMQKLNLKMQTQISEHTPKEHSTSGRKKKVKVALPNNIVYTPGLAHMENKENEAYRRRDSPTTHLIQDTKSVKIIKHQGRIQMPADVYLEDSQDFVTQGALSRFKTPLMKNNLVDMSVLEPHNVQHTNTIQKKSKSRLPY